MTYSFRAECLPDVGLFISELSKIGVDASITIRFNRFNEPKVEMVNVGLTFRELQVILANIEDGHVMAETLRAVPLADNSLIRRYVSHYDGLRQLEALCQPETPEDTDDTEMAARVAEMNV